MSEREYKERAWIVTYADLVFAENSQEAFENMNEGVNNFPLPVSDAIEIGDSKDYPILSSYAQIDEAVREKLDAFVQEFSDWAKRQKESHK